MAIKTKRKAQEACGGEGQEGVDCQGAKRGKEAGAEKSKEGAG